MSLMSAVSWKLLIALDVAIACSRYLDTSISHTQRHLWKLSPTDLVTVETCYQSSDKLVWIIWQCSKVCLRAVWNVLRGVMSLEGPFPRSPQRPEQHCPLPNGTVRCLCKVTSDSETARDKQLRSMVASPLAFLKKSVTQGFCFSSLHQL